MSDTKDEFRDMVYELMKLVDERLSIEDMRLKERPLSACISIVHNFITDVTGGKDDFAEKPWFAILYFHVMAWYREHYGPAFDKDSSSIGHAVIMIRDLPVAYHVPLTRIEPGTPGETVWLCFPIGIEAGEDPRNWLVNPPQLSRLDSRQIKRLEKDMTTVATALRALPTLLQGITPKDNVVTGLIDGVTDSLESAAQTILRNDPRGRGGAIWALQMAVERTLKGLSQHKHGAFREIHDLFALFDDVAAYCPTVNRNLLKRFPRQDQVMIDRYGLGGIPTLTEVMNAYMAALLLIAGVAKSFTRSLNIAGGRLHIRKAPWLTLPPSPNSKLVPESGG